VFVASRWHPEKSKAISSVQTKAEINGAGFCGRIGFLGNVLIGLIFLAYSAGLEKARFM
jgi:hypothetical protein